MADQPSAFSKKNLQAVTINPEAKRGVLEELNLPPQVISFVRQYKKHLEIAGIGVVVFSLAWIFFDYYTEKQRDLAATELTAALELKDDQSRIAALVTVEKEYGRTTSALWSRIELANIAYQEKKFPEARDRYKAVLDDLDTDNPLTPVVRLAYAKVLESGNETDQALDAYKTLSKSPGFSGEGLKGMGRIYELKNNMAEAKKAYEEYLASEEGLPAGESALITSKLAQLVDLPATAQ